MTHLWWPAAQNGVLRHPAPLRLGHTIELGKDFHTTPSRYPRHPECHIHFDHGETGQPLTARTNQESHHDGGKGPVQISWAMGKSDHPPHEPAFPIPIPTGNLHSCPVCALNQAAYAMADRTGSCIAGIPVVHTNPCGSGPKQKRPEAVRW